MIKNELRCLACGKRLDKNEKCLRLVEHGGKKFLVVACSEAHFNALIDSDDLFSFIHEGSMNSLKDFC